MHGTTLTLAQRGEKGHGVSRDLWVVLRSFKQEDARACVADLCQATGYAGARVHPDLVMTCDEFRQLAADPVATIAAHRHRHFVLAKLTLAEAVHRDSPRALRASRKWRHPNGDERSGNREFQRARELGKGLLRPSAPPPKPRSNLVTSRCF